MAGQQQDSSPGRSFDLRFSDVLVRRRLLLLALSALMTLAAAAGVLRLGFDTSIDTLLTRSDPYLEELRDFERNFPSQLEIYFAFVAAPGSTVFTPAVLRAVDDLQTRSTRFAGVQSFSSLVDYFSPQRQQRLFQRPVESYSGAELEALQRQSLADPLLTNSLLSADGRLTRASIGIDPRTVGEGQRLEIAQQALALRDALRRDHPDLSIYVNSDVLLEQSSRQDMLSDLTTLLPIIILVCVLTICYCFRSAILGLCILGHVILTVVSTIGTLGYLGFAFNSISVIAPLVVVIIAVANSVHVVSIFRQALGRGLDRPAAMRHSLATNLRPVTLAALTTAIGFTSLNLCSSPAVQDFGRIVALGILFAYVFTLTLLPTLLIFFGRSLQQRSAPGRDRLGGVLAALIGFARRRDRAVFLSCTALSLLAFMLLPLNETDFNRLDFIDGDSEMADYYRVIQEHMERGPSLAYAIDTGALDGVIEPAFLRRLEDFGDWLDAQPEVESSASMVDVVKTIGQAANSGDPAYFRIPDDIDTVAYYLNSYEVVQSDDFPLAAFTNLDFSMVTLFVNARATSNQGLLDLDEKISAGFPDYFEDARLVHGSGLLLFARMDETVTKELLEGYSLSLVLITLTLIIGLGSFYYGMLSILPNLLPAVIVFGAWGLFVGQLDPFVMMLFSISIGLVVDDTVHILSHYLSYRRAGVEQPVAMERAVLVAGPALTITTLVLALGTTFLIAADTLYFQQSAKLLVPIVLIALLLDLIYLPTILRRCDRQRA